MKPLRIAYLHRTILCGGATTNLCLLQRSIRDLPSKVTIVNPWLSLAATIALIALYPGLLYLLRFFRPGELAWIRSLTEMVRSGAGAQ